MAQQDAIQRRLRGFRNRRQSTVDSFTPATPATPATGTPATPASPAKGNKQDKNMSAPGFMAGAVPVNNNAGPMVNPWYMNQQRTNMPGLADPNIPWEWQEQWSQPKTALQEAIERYRQRGIPTAK